MRRCFCSLCRSDSGPSSFGLCLEPCSDVILRFFSPLPLTPPVMCSLTPCFNSPLCRPGRGRVATVRVFILFFYRCGVNRPWWEFSHLFCPLAQALNGLKTCPRCLPPIFRGSLVFECEEIYYFSLFPSGFLYVPPAFVVGHAALCNGGYWAVGLQNWLGSSRFFPREPRSRTWVTE